MNILLVNNLYPPYSRGGAETAVVAEAKVLASLGHEVAVLTTQPFSGWSSLWPKQSVEDGVVVLRFFPLNFFWYRNDGKHSALVRALWYVANFFSPHPTMVLRKVLKEGKADVVHLHNINGISYRYPKLLKKLGVPTIFTLHAVHYAIPSGVILHAVESPKAFGSFAALARRVLASNAIITSPSQWLLDFYTTQKFFKRQKTAVVPNPLSKKLSFEISKSRNLETFHILYVGQLEAYKGLNILLAAIKQLPPEYRFELDLVGDGNMFEQLRRAREQRVRVRGRLSGEELAACYANADVLVMPSLCEENAPMVIAESFSHGVPVIATRVGGIPEMVEENVTGMLYSPADLEELVMHLRRVIERPEVLEAMRENCRKAASRYASGVVTASYLEIFQNFQVKK